MDDTVDFLAELFPWALDEKTIIQSYINGKIDKEEYIRRMDEFRRRDKTR